MYFTAVVIHATFMNDNIGPGDTAPFRKTERVHRMPVASVPPDDCNIT